MKLHLRSTATDDNTPACGQGGRLFSRMTTDKTKVTCRRCIAVQAARQRRGRLRAILVRGRMRGEPTAKNGMALWREISRWASKRGMRASAVTRLHDGTVSWTIDREAQGQSVTAGDARAALELVKELGMVSGCTVKVVEYPSTGPSRRIAGRQVARVARAW